MSIYELVNFFTCSLLIDVSNLKEMEELMVGITSFLGDFKLCAQKCSALVNRRHYIKKSDERQLLIICWYIFIISLLFLTFITFFSRSKYHDKTIKCPFQITGNIAKLTNEGYDNY